MIIRLVLAVRIPALLLQVYCCLHFHQLHRVTSQFLQRFSFVASPVRSATVPDGRPWCFNEGFFEKVLVKNVWASNILKLKLICKVQCQRSWRFDIARNLDTHADDVIQCVCHKKDEWRSDKTVLSIPSSTLYWNDFNLDYSGAVNAAAADFLTQHCSNHKACLSCTGLISQAILKA